MESSPSDEELREFVGATLSSLDMIRREPEVIDESIRQHRETWVLLYRVSSSIDDGG